jgi:UDP-glucose 4-epimerase
LQKNELAIEIELFIYSDNAKNEDKRANGEIFIATDGTPHSSCYIYNAMCGTLDKSIPKWSVPKILFDMASLVNPCIKYKLNKLLGDKCYSSAKFEALGFKAKKTLKDMNETSFRVGTGNTYGTNLSRQLGG